MVRFPCSVQTQNSSRYNVRLFSLQLQLILNNNNIICEMIREEQEFENELSLRMIPKHRNTFNSIVRILKLKN